MRACHETERLKKKRERKQKREYGEGNTTEVRGSFTDGQRERESMNRVWPGMTAPQAITSYPRGEAT
jgi:hypothetical protein